MNERSLVVWIGGGLAAAAVAAVVLFLLLRSDGESNGGSSIATGGNAAASLEGGPDEVLYLSGTSLVRRNLANGQEEPVAEVPSPSVYASPGSHWVAYVTSKRGSGGDDFSAEPVLHLYDLANDEKSGYGAGVAPLWNPGGTHVAFLRPVEPRNCQGETCPGDVQIGVVEAATGRESLLLEPGTYSILGWAGEWILVSDFEDPARIFSVSLDDERKELDMPASQYWDSSPDGRWVVKTNAKKTEFVAVEDGELGDERVTVELEDYQLLEGAWAHDSSRVAAVVGLTEKKGKGGKRSRGVGFTTEVVTFSPEDPVPSTVAGTAGAARSVFWSVDNDSIVFTALLDQKRSLFQAQQCPVGNQTGCEIVTSWTEGVSLLRTE
ncbi:MAG TPA: hypothetical protein VHI71_04600 [Actinomycetota bacterium]|nr:hypothetical protein [Actinomycetota bacterium]